MNGVFRVPQPVNEPVRSYGPGSAEKKSLKAKLAEMRGRQIEIPLIIGGEEVRTGKLGTCVVPHDHGHVLATLPQGGQGRGGAGDRGGARGPRDVVAGAVRGACLDPAPRRRDARGAVPRRGQRGDDARAVEDGVPGRDRLGVRADRLLALQPVLRAADLRGAARVVRRGVEPGRVPPARGVRLRGDAVQLHLDRRQPADVAGVDGEHRAVEAGVERGLLRVPPHEGADRGRAAGGRRQHGGRVGRGGGQPGPRQPGAGRHPLHRLHRGVPADVEDDRQQHRELPLVPADRRRDRRQGLRLRARLRRRRLAGDRPRARRVRVPGAEVLGGVAGLRPRVAVAEGQGGACWPSSPRSRSATPRTSPTSWAP